MTNMVYQQVWIKQGQYIRNEGSYQFYQVEKIFGDSEPLKQVFTQVGHINTVICILLGRNYQLEWGPNQDAVFTAVKQELTAPNVLTLYDPYADTKI